MRNDETVGPDSMSATTCTGGSAVVESWSGQDYAFLTLDFKGSADSRVALTRIVSLDGVAWRICPEHPERLTVDSAGCHLQFAATRAHAEWPTATVCLCIDGGPEQSVQVDLRLGADVPHS
jgi:hypothetical protein